MVRLAELSTYPDYFRWQFIKNPVVTMKMWYEEEYWVWDSDDCGSCTSFWVWIKDIEPPIFYRIHHEWWQDSDGGWINEDEVRQITKAELMEEIKKVDKFTQDYVKRNLGFVV
jgi:hypothetical protein